MSSPLQHSVAAGTETSAAHPQAKCHQPLPKPIVQVAFDPPPGVIDSRHAAGLGGALLDYPGQLHPGLDAQLAEHPPQMRADRRLGQPPAIRHDPAGETLRGQVNHRPFGISQAQPATGARNEQMRHVPRRRGSGRSRTRPPDPSSGHLSAAAVLGRDQQRGSKRIERVEQYRIARSIENASSRSRVLAQVAAAMAAVDPQQAARLGAVEIRAPLTKISNATEDTVLRASNRTGLKVCSSTEWQGQRAVILSSSTSSATRQSRFLPGRQPATLYAYMNRAEEKVLICRWWCAISEPWLAGRVGAALAAPGLVALRGGALQSAIQGGDRCPAC